MALKIVIIGNGITGITAARNIRKLSDAHITVISDEGEYFFSRTALMYVYMGHLKFEHTQPYENWFWKKNKINLLKQRVVNVDFSHKKVNLSNDDYLNYDKLIIATGSKPKILDVPGKHLKGVQNLYSKQDVELMEINTVGVRKAVVVGGGLTGIEMAEMLHSRNIKVDLLIREQNYWASVLPLTEAKMISDHIRSYHINLYPLTEIKEIIGDENGTVKSIITSNDEEINCQFVGITVGVQPNVSFLKNSEINIDKGILVNEFLETNIKDVYAAGDCAQFSNPKYKHPAIEQLWYTGKMQGEALAQTICGQKTVYNRGVWFNSAKFLAIEYQTYGNMFNQPADDENTFYWQHEKNNIAMRVNFNASNFTLVGFNFLGIRFKQVIAEDWILQQKNIWEVMENLQVGFFDPEFFKNPHKEILKQFLHQYPKASS